MSRFQPGQSGNPSGRPSGTGKAAKLRTLFEPHAKKLAEKVVAIALEGDTTALRLCLERLIPPLKAEAQPVHLTGVEGSLEAQGSAIIPAMAKGQVSPDQASDMLRALAAQGRIVEVEELEQRVATLEAKDAKRA